MGAYRVRKAPSGESVDDRVLERGRNIIMTIMNQELRYGDWRIFYDPPPIPIRTLDWEFIHDGYDGPETSKVMAGRASSIEDAKAQIDEIEDDWS